MLFIYLVMVLDILVEIYLAFKNSTTKKWTKVEGELITSEVNVGSSEMEINYTYTVNGVEYKSNKIAYTTIRTFFVLLKGSYINKDNLEVFYNPNKHEESVLVSGVRLVHILNILTVCAGLAFVYSVVGL